MYIINLKNTFIEVKNIINLLIIIFKHIYLKQAQEYKTKKYYYINLNSLLVTDLIL